jgi:hypothetical protein
VIDPERKLFAAHGFASYRAQLLEQRLAWLLCTAFGDKPAAIPPEERDQIYRERSEDTFGRLIGHLRTRLGPDHELVRELEHRLNDRNYLVHRFFWSHAEDIVDKERRDFLMQELDKMAERFLAANQRLQRVYYDWLVANGIPRDVLARFLREKRAAVKTT